MPWKQIYFSWLWLIGHGSTQSCVVAQAGSSRYLRAEVRVHSQPCPCGICVRQIGTATGSPASTFGFPVKVIPEFFHILSLLHVSQTPFSLSNRRCLKNISESKEGHEMCQYEIAVKNEAESAPETIIITFPKNSVIFQTTIQIENPVFRRWYVIIQDVGREICHTLR
jgi:hypothetical protein